MLGVIANSNDWAAVEEFFQLFKTPWERFRPGQRYDALLVATTEAPPLDSARVIIVYGSQNSPVDSLTECPVRECLDDDRRIAIGGETLPIYGALAAFHVRGQAADCLAKLSGKSGSVAVRTSVAGRTIIRVGYDLFTEIRFLITRGQPPENALIPALDLHINVLRNFLVRESIAVVEIPPVPAGASIIACLTHDVDFVFLRQHRFDHSMWGFLYRATVGSIVDWIAGRKGFGAVSRNCAAACKLPLVHLGMCRDFWQQFDGYLKVEKGKPSTFYIIPFKGRPGSAAPSGRSSSRRRATCYDIEDIPEWVTRLQNAGCEVALHGIDAWHDEESAREERDRIASFTGKQRCGLRMHWLYFGDRSVEVLDKAEFDYDSTCGFNEAVGFRAGTTQVFRPLGASHLLELPMHIQDTALFYPGRMHLTDAEAWRLCSDLLEKASENGGVLTILWHDRSLAPERLWGDFYEGLIARLEAAGAWFGTAEEVVGWFRARREIRFGSMHREEKRIRVELDKLPPVSPRGFKIRVTWLSDEGHVLRREVALAGESCLFVEASEGEESPVTSDFTANRASEATMSLNA